MLVTWRLEIDFHTVPPYYTKKKSGTERQSNICYLIKKTTTYVVLCFGGRQWVVTCSFNEFLCINIQRKRQKERYIHREKHIHYVCKTYQCFFIKRTKSFSTVYFALSFQNVRRLENLLRPNKEQSMIQTPSFPRHAYPNLTKLSSRV